MCALSAGNESLNEMEYTCFRVGSSNRIHRNGWRPWTPRLCAKAFECWAGSWNGPRMASPGGRSSTCTARKEIVRCVGRSVTTPGVRDRLTDIEGEVPIVPIDKKASDRCRANTMRAQCLSSDRPDIQIECRDLARKMQQLSNLDEIGLKRLSRLLGVRPSLVWLFKCQKRGCALMLGRWSPKARSHSARSLPQRCLQTFSRNTSMLQRCKVAWLDWE